MGVEQLLWGEDMVRGGGQVKEQCGPAIGSSSTWLLKQGVASENSSEPTD